MESDVSLDLDAAALRHGESFKWSRYPDDVLPLWVADMDFAVAPSILRALHERLSLSIGYHPLAPNAPLTHLLRAKFEQQGIVGLPEKGWIKYLGGVVSGLYAAVSALTSPGDEVITFTPIYPPFLSAIHDQGRVMREARLTPAPDGWQIDWDALEAAVTPATRLLMLCNPHNPTGRVWTRDELTRLGEFAARHRLWVVSDELHGDLTLDGPFTPFVTAVPNDVPPRPVTLTGPGKTYNTAGLGIGAMLSHYPPLVSRLQKSLAGIAPHPAALSVTMWEAALKDDGAWLAAVHRQLRANRQTLAQFVRDHLPGVSYLGTQATYLAWLDYRAHPRAGDIQHYLLKTAKVALNNGPDFGPGYQGFVRLNFATSPAILRDALERLAAAHVPAD
ncbi:MAG: MalY/PatB family protein [Tepidisphaeraceae bacterium]